MGEKGNLEPATVVDGDAGRSAASVAVGVAATSGAKLTDAVIAESAGAEVEPSRQRFGHHLAPTAFGEDLYLGGRSARLRCASGGTVSAGDHLARCWAHARPLAVERLGIGAAAAVDAVVRSDLPLPAPAPIVDPVAGSSA
ncbi:MAG: hypothetical protein R2702_15415 [Acidimicrobiales bacterium]